MDQDIYKDQVTQLSYSISFMQEAGAHSASEKLAVSGQVKRD